MPVPTGSPVLDAFTRPDVASPPGPGWGDNTFGFGTGLGVASGQAAPSRDGADCDSYWATPIGPDVEVGCTVATKPPANAYLGVAARVQSPGSSAADGYYLMVKTLAGTDKWVLYRVTNAAFTQLATATQETTAGDRVALVAVGDTLEAWWWPAAGSPSLVVTATDTTYQAAGVAGLGVGGPPGSTAARLDDFWAAAVTTIAPRAALVASRQALVRAAAW